MNTETKVMLAVVICCIASLLIYLINLKRKNRKYQSILPVISGIYAVLATGALMVYKEDIVNFINEKGIGPDEKLQYLNHFYTIDSLEHTDIALFNGAIIISYLLIKLIILCFLSASKKSNETDKDSETKAYYYDLDNEVWFLKEEWVNFRSLMKWLSFGMTIASAIFIGLTCYFGNEHQMWVYIFVVIPLIVILEITNYYNGYTKEEFYHKVFGIDAFSQRVNNFHKLRALYEVLFKNELLAANTSNEYSNVESGNEIVEQLKKSDDYIERVTGEFFDNNNENHYEVDNLIASVNLIKNKNVVFFNPFYRDLTDYVALPLINTLLSSGKCLVVLGRNSVGDDVKAWLGETIKDYTKMESLWRINILSHKTPDCEIGILTSSSLYDLTILRANYDFFTDVKLILFVEPSLIINTAQISLSIIAKRINHDGNKAIFCVFDRPTDGLVDTLSHVMKDEIVDVVAPPIPNGSYTAMAWNADGDYLRENLFDKQTKFLGNGIELAAVAVKNQISKVTWFSESKAPVRDIKWIAAQYYPTLCKYMHIPAQQKSLHEKIKFESNLWSAPREKDNFIIAEDEFNNLFITMRAFLSRGISQSFVNVFSENYLLRDYMRCNTRMFLSNPNTIPSLVPDYAKTQRNLIIKLIMIMSISEMEEQDIVKELQLINIETDNVLRTLYELISKYTDADEQILSIRNVESEIGELNPFTYYSVKKEIFEKCFSNSLKTAYYIVEHEKDQVEYLDSKLYGHITQLLLPGQYVTYDGKYYKVKYISSNSGVILRRASDLYNNNEYYRQIRKYNINSVNEVISERKIIDIEFSILQCDFDVETDGYLQLNSNNDLRNARVIKFGLDSEKKQYVRSYKNKNILRIKLPETDDRIRFTLSMLLAELFKTVYPSSWQYLAVVSAIPDDIDGMLNYMIYTVNKDIDEDYIYIIEDSYIDLGLLNSVEKNIFRFFEIIADYLDWHEEKMREPEHKDPVHRSINSIDEREEEKKRSLFTKMAQRIRKLFVRDKEEDVVIKDPSDKNIDNKHDDTKPKNDNGNSDGDDYSIDNENEKTKNAINPVDNNQGESNDSSTEISDDLIVNIDDKTGERVIDDKPLAEEQVQNQSTVFATNQLANEPDPLYEPQDEKYSVMNTEDDESSENVGTDDTDNNSDNKDEISEVVSETERIKNRFSDEDYIPTDEENPELTSIDGTDIFDTDGTPDDYLLELQFQEMGILPVKKTRYQKECYLKFGFEDIDARLKIDDLKRYLRVHGWANNNLTKARKRDILAKQLIDFDAENHCDFCGLPLSGVSYDRLGDGRIRCIDCSNNTISTVNELKELFNHILETLDDFYGVNYKFPIAVEMQDAKTVAKKAGMIFKPSKDYAERVLGFAKYSHGKYSLVIENGSPKLATIDTMVHEMTHIWQYINWPDSKISDIYQMPNKKCSEKSTCDKIVSLIVYEGMAMWSSIQYLYQMGETYYASQQEAIAESRNDVYGIGFRLYKEQYPIVKDGSLLKYTPFMEFPTIDPDEVINEVRKLCINPDFSC